VASTSAPVGQQALQAIKATYWAVLSRLENALNNAWNERALSRDLSQLAGAY